MSNAVFEWLDVNSRIDYPLVGRGATPAGLYELLVDAYVIHNSGDRQEVQITAFDPAGDLELRFADATLLATLTVADGFQSSTWGEWTVLQWQRQTVTAVDLTDEEIVARLVLKTSKLADFVFPIAPTGATLQPSLVVNRTPRVRRVIQALPGVPLATYHTAPIDGIIRLDAGYNMKIDVTEDAVPSTLALPAEPSVRPKTRITFNAVAGEGLGKYNPCGTPEGIKKINGVSPDQAGNFFLEAQDCYWVERPLSGARIAPTKPGTDYHASVIPNTLRIHNQCSACCACSDYGNAYKEIVLLWNRAKAASKRIEHSRQRYHTMRDFLLNVKTEREVGLRVFLQVVPRPDFSVSVQMTTVNNSPTDIDSAITIRASLSYTPDILESTYLERSGRLDAETQHNVQVDPTISGETYSVVVPYLRAAHYALYSFDVRCTKKIVSAINRQDVVVRVTAAAVHGSNTAYDTGWARLAKPVEKE